MTERTLADSETDLSGLMEDPRAPVGAIDPRRPKRPRFWPETTPLLGATPVLPDAESPPAAPADAG